MWIQASGQLTENVFLVATSASTHLLIGGEKIGIVDAGLSATAKKLTEEINVFIESGLRLDFVFVTHAHFDHVGGIPALREAFPGLQIVSSPQTAAKLNNKDVVSELFEKNIQCHEVFEDAPALDRKRWEAALKIDKVMGDGDGLDLGVGVHVKAVFTPGHSEDSICYFVPSDAALAGGEALGDYRGRDLIFPCFTENFRDYIASIDKISGLDVRVLGLPHSGALTGELAQKYLAELRLSADKLKQTIAERLQAGETADEIFGVLLSEWKLQNISPEGPFVAAQEDSLRSMIRVVAEGR